MILHGWQAVGVVLLIVLGVLALVALMFRWFEVADWLGLPVWLTMTILVVALVVALAVFVGMTGLRV